MVSNVTIGASLLSRSGGGGIDSSLLARAATRGSGAGGGFTTAGGISTALAQAERNEARELALTAKLPEVKRDIARFERLLSKAKTVEEFLDDPIARKVFLKANGLGAMTDYVGLVKRALTADLNDPKSLPYQLANGNRAWMETAAKFNFKLFGMLSLKTDETRRQIIDDYVAEARLDNLDRQVPGLGSALLFKKMAASLDTPIKILGSALGREVVTVAFSIPPQIAVQSIKAQEKAVMARLDPKDLADPKFAHAVAQRYLLQLNGGNGGIYA